MSLVGIFWICFDLPFCLFVIGLQFALSPTYCSAVQIRNDGKVKWKQLDYHMGDIGSSMEDGELLIPLSFHNDLKQHSTLCSCSCSTRAVLRDSSNG